ncbi:MAG TPA: hypothetical protein VNO30_28510 [Kofleriaceae bacterium]|nr:hypothetical protein [Kofleriaceae bacterium]
MSPIQRVNPGPLLRPLLALLVLPAAACNGDDSGIDPTEVRFGDTALVVVVNPTVNDGNRRPVPAPGSARAGITLRSDDGVSDTTEADGIAVLAPLSSGIRTITISGDGIDGSFTVTMAAGALREVALAAEGGRAELMLDLDYKSDRVVEISPAMAIAQVNDALRVSDRVVFLAGGVYAGDLDFSGSRVTLFGEGVLGGTVTLQGNVTMSGSDSRIRGARITGNLTIPASGTGLSFSRVDGTTTAEGSDTTLLANALCGTDTITGSGSLAVGNAGVPPTTACP